MSRVADIIREHATALEPRPTIIVPRLDPIDDVRAVLFDVYGTLIISGCGDISLVGGTDSVAAFGPSLKDVQIEWLGTERVARDIFHQTIRNHQQRIADESPHPEVDILHVWHDAVAELANRDMLGELPAQIDWQQLAIGYEMRVNPVWPMPGLVECCEAIRKAGLALGIVSNAQFFTRDLFAGLCDRSLADLGFADELCFWSYQHLRAKPDTWLYQLAAEALVDRGIEPHQTLYIGNDMRNDVMPAAKVGFRTVLFAGDKRSLRLRKGDSSVAGVVPDRVVTNLDQLKYLLSLAHT